MTLRTNIFTGTWQNQSKRFGGAASRANTSTSRNCGVWYRGFRRIPQGHGGGTSRCAKQRPAHAVWFDALGNDIWVNAIKANRLLSGRREGDAAAAAAAAAAAFRWKRRSESVFRLDPTILLPTTASGRKTRQKNATTRQIYFYIARRLPRCLRGVAPSARATAN